MMKKINLLIAIYKYIKKTVLIIFSYIYIYLIHLGWFLLIVVILIIAFIALHLDEDLENEQPNSLEQPKFIRLKNIQLKGKY